MSEVAISWFMVIFNTTLMSIISCVFVKHSKYKFFHLVPMISVVLLMYFELPYAFLYMRNYFVENYGNWIILISQLYITASYMLLLAGYGVFSIWLPKHHINNHFGRIDGFLCNVRLVMKLHWFWGFVVLAIASSIIIFNLVGGIRYYITHLSDTGILTAGKIYLVAGTIAFKFAFIMYYINHDALSLRRKKPVLMTLLFMIALSILVLFGRLNAVIFILQVVLISFFIVKHTWLSHRIFLTGFILLVIVFVYGEYRTFTGIARVGGYDFSIEGYMKYIVNTKNIFNEFIARVFLNYFDANDAFLLRLSSYTNSDLKGGLTYLSLFIQPIPRFLRVQIFEGLVEQMRKPGFGYGRVTSMFEDSIINFGMLGITTFAVFGFALSVVQNLFLNSRIFDKRLLGIIIYPHLLSLIRGSFVGAMSFLLIDLVYGIFMIKLAFSKRSSRVEAINTPVFAKVEK